MKTSVKKRGSKRAVSPSGATRTLDGMGVTLAEASAQAPLFRGGIAAFLAMQVAFLVPPFALYRVLGDVDRRAAILIGPGGGQRAGRAGGADAPAGSLGAPARRGDGRRCRIRCKPATLGPWPARRQPVLGALAASVRLAGAALSALAARARLAAGAGALHTFCRAGARHRAGSCRLSFS